MVGSQGLGEAKRRARSRNGSRGCYGCAPGVSTRRAQSVRNNPRGPRGTRARTDPSSLRTMPRPSASAFFLSLSGPRERRLGRAPEGGERGLAARGALALALRELGLAAAAAAEVRREEG